MDFDVHVFLTIFFNFTAFDDSNIGLCSVCLDDNFQIVHQYGVDTACDKCVDEIVKNQ